jgi:signal transduction histidine kinase
MGAFKLGISNDAILDAAILAVSLFNTMLLVWLGLTVLLNAARRTWGIWLAGSGLLMGAAFFLSHSVLVGQDVNFFSPSMNFWWHAGWLPVTLSPLAWYIVMLWYSGFWDRGDERIHQRHRYGMAFSILFSGIILGLLALANPFPAFSRLANLRQADTAAVGGIPLLVLLFPIYLVTCIGLSLEALLYPGQSGRMMGQLARRRARPWLIAASTALLGVSILVGWVMVWVIRQPAFDAQMALGISRFDLSISLLLSSTIILTGQAIVNYEVFTGKTLPRHGLQKHWRRLLFLAAGFGLVVSASLAFNFPPIYSLLLGMILVVVFYALLNWRDYAERERMIAQLRPFVASQQLYEQLVAAPPAGRQEADIQTPFDALCRELLQANAAYLLPLGPLAPLFGAALAYPSNSRPPEVIPETLKSVLGKPQGLFMPLEQGTYSEAAWAISLWSERGLDGLLLLGEKVDGSLYTQEEFEIARATAERLIDIQASAEMARRLMAMQRQRTAENLLVDQRTRRVLHDEVLPLIHAALLESSGGSHDTPGQETASLLSEAHRHLSDLLHELPMPQAPELSRLGIVTALRHFIEREMQPNFDPVIWQIAPGAEEKARSIPPLAAETLYFAAREVVRNAARHGPGDQSVHKLRLEIRVSNGDPFCISIEDNGVGIGSQTKPQGSTGQGLALHGTAMAVIGGTLDVESQPGKFTRVRLKLPHSAFTGWVEALMPSGASED